MSGGVGIARWVLLSLVAWSDATESIWVEGEEAKSSSFVRHGWYDAVAKEAMSGKQWLSHYDPAKPGTATWEFQSKEGDEVALPAQGDRRSKHLTRPVQSRRNS